MSHRERFLNDYNRITKEPGCKASVLGISKKILEARPEILKEYPSKEKALEYIRSIVRIYTGTDSHSRANANKKETAVAFHELQSSEFEQHRYILDDYQITGKNGLILTDVHFPFASLETIDVALNHGKKQGVDFILLNGDLVDCYHGSRFDKNPTMPAIEKEFEMAANFIKMLQKNFPDTKIIWKMGNHEDRWEISANKTLFAKFKVASMGGIMESEFDVRGIDYVESKQLMKIGKLTGAHGHELSSGANSPIGIARSTGMKIFMDCFVGHSHITNSFQFKRGDGTYFRCYSIGAACYLKADYARVNRWNNGFAYVETDDDDFTFYNYLLDDKFKKHII